MEQLAQCVNSAPTRPRRVFPGRVIGGKYRLDRSLGEGGMGIVWHATHLELDAPVAIKLLSARHLSSTKLVAAFLREAKAAAAVRHRNVVSTTDFGTDADGQPYMVMELLEGTSLASRLAPGERLPVEEIVDVVAQCLAGLAAVHCAGILHRDLKPENIFLVDEGDSVYPKLIDFGVSLSLRPSPELVARPGVQARGAMSTMDGAMVGTPHYMSPEQACGLSDVDQRADLYAMGVILYEGLTGRLPYDAASVQALLQAIVRGGAPPLARVRSDVGIALSAVVAKAMASREARYSDAREMRAALLAATTPRPVDAYITPPRPEAAVEAAPPDALPLSPSYRGSAMRLAAVVGVLTMAAVFAGWAALATSEGVRPASAQAVRVRVAVPDRPSVRHFATPLFPVKRAVAISRDQARFSEALPRFSVAPQLRRLASSGRQTRRAAPSRANGFIRDPGF